MALIATQPLQRASAIILLEGDGWVRVERAVELFQVGWSKKIVVSGGLNKPELGSFPASELKKKLMASGIPEADIILEDQSMNTREQAEAVVALARQTGWDRILLVGTEYHQYRAFLTFLKVVEETKSELEIINAPATPSWFALEPWGRRIDLLGEELQKIERYQASGDVASWEAGLAYFVHKTLS